MYKGFYLKNILKTIQPFPLQRNALYGGSRHLKIPIECLTVCGYNVSKWEDDKGLLILLQTRPLTKFQSLKAKKSLFFCESKKIKD